MSQLKPRQPVAMVSWDDFNFSLYEKFRSGFQEWDMSREIILSLVQLGFSYSSAVISLNSAFVLGLVATKSGLVTTRSNPIKAICYL